MISVAMCTYNGEKYIQEQLESIIYQSVPPDEIVICDDCSNDATLEIVKDILNSYDGIVQLVSNKHNLGYRKNFEKAISLCHGDIIFLSDQDDVWSSNKIEIIKTEIEKDQNILLAFHDVEIVDENLCLTNKSFWNVLHFDYMQFLENDFRRLMESNVIQGSACAFRRELFTYAVPFPECAVHDEWLGLIAFAKGKILPINLKLAKYRQSHNNAIGAGNITFIKKIKRYLNNSKADYNPYIQVLEKRHKTIQAYYEYLTKEKELQKVNALTFEFYNKRINWLRNRCILNIVTSLDYFKFFCTRKLALKCMLRDMIACIYH